MSDDRGARAAALDPTRSFVVQAPAGSGKTTLLTQRLLRLLTTVEYPEQVVAITFTRKAAEEMRARIIAAIELAAGAEPADGFQQQTWQLARALLAHDRAQGWELRAHPSRLRIMTIDALCQHIVRLAPLAAGMPGLPGIEEDAVRLYRDAARDTISAIAGGGAPAPAIVRLLDHLDNDWSRLERLIADMLGRRDQWLRVLGHGPGHDRLQQSFAAVVAAELASARALLPEALCAALVTLGDCAGSALRASDPDCAIAALAGITAMPPAELQYLSQWQGLAALLLTADGNWRSKVTKAQGFPPGRDGAAMKQRFSDTVALLAEIPGALPALRRVARCPARLFMEGEREVIDALLTVLHTATAHLVVRGQYSGRVDFTAYAMAAAQALGDPDQPSDLALRLDYRLQHLLVDEFQDTSLIQYDLIRRLVAGWSGEDGRTLFLVGDPMQSIYRFRQADVNLFMHVLAHGMLEGVELHRLALTVNFRAQAGLVRWINAALPAALAGADAFAVPFVAQQAVKPDSGPAWRLHARATHDAAAEAAQVLATVQDIRAATPAASIAVLVRSRRHLGRITRQLAARGIAVAARDIQPLNEVPAVSDVLALTRALLHLDDRIAWLALLRAPWCGLTLASLHALAARGGLVLDAMADAALTRALAGEDAARLARVHPILEQAVAAAATRPLARLVEQTWIALGGPAALDGEQAVADVRVALACITELEQDAEPLSVRRLQQRLAERYSSAPAGDPAAVQVMTIHRAKGLEFDHVIVPGLGRTPRVEQRRLLMWRDTVDRDQRAVLLLAPLPAHGKSPLYEYLRAWDKAENASEAVRLLYVALTRARCQVHLLGHASCAASGEPQPAKGSFLAMLWPTLAVEFSAGLDPASGAVSEDAPVAPAPPRLRRLALAQLPLAPVLAPALAVPGAETRLAFDWAGASARHIGTVAHRLLQEWRPGNEGTAAGWSPAAVAFARGQLRGLGVAESRLDDALAQLAIAMRTIADSARGRWLFSAEHREIASELHLNVIEHGHALRVVIDRTFVDADGRRWIVDFKTGVHGGGALDAWLDAEVVRYRPQLERYARIMAAVDPRPIMLGLYFPLLDAWREWPYAPD